MPADTEQSSQHAPLFYAYQSGGPLWHAGLIMLIAAGLALLLPNAALRALAALFIFPPLIWGSYELARRRTGITLEVNEFALRRPISLRPLRIPYEQIGNATAWPHSEKMSVAYYLPRPPFEGEDDPRPPRLRLTITEPLDDLPQALAELQQRIDQAQAQNSLFPPLATEEIHRRLRMRRFRRVSRNLAALLITPILVFLLIRIIFTLLRLF